MQLNIHQKACGLLNVNGFYDSLIEFLETMSEKRLIKEEQRQQLLVETDPETLVERILNTEVEEIEKWIKG